VVALLPLRTARLPTLVIVTAVDLKVISRTVISPMIALMLLRIRVTLAQVAIRVPREGASRLLQIARLLIREVVALTLEIRRLLVMGTITRDQTIRPLM